MDPAKQDNKCPSEEAVNTMKIVDDIRSSLLYDVYNYSAYIINKVVDHRITPKDIVSIINKVSKDIKDDCLGKIEEVKKSPITEKVSAATDTIILYTNFLIMFNIEQDLHKILSDTALLFINWVNIFDEDIKHILSQDGNKLEGVMRQTYHNAQEMDRLRDMCIYLGDLVSLSGTLKGQISIARELIGRAQKIATVKVPELDMSPHILGNIITGSDKCK